MPPPSNKPSFKVHLDPVGHVLIECLHGPEKIETGLRGLEHLIERGFVIKPRYFHLDPLLRHVEIDNEVFQCNEEGAARLESALNSKLCPDLGDESKIAVHVSENTASATGFDIRFDTIAFGLRKEAFDHLSEKTLETLQDLNHCKILQPGIVLRLSPPYLTARRKDPDGIEWRIPGLPDLSYRAATCEQVQEFLNHPLLRTAVGVGKAPEPLEAQPIVSMHVIHNPQNPMFLWVDCKARDGQTISGKAWTHRNIAEWQHLGIFDDRFDLSLSFDNRTLSLLEKSTHREEHIAVNHGSSPDDLNRASALLTRALSRRPVKASPIRIEAGSATAAGATKSPKTPVEEPSPIKVAARNVPTSAPMAAPAPAPSASVQVDQPPEISPRPSWLDAFNQVDPKRANIEIFNKLAKILNRQLLDIELSLDRVFVNRRFEILGFSHSTIASVFELRSPAFHGFYLSHVGHDKVLLVYANGGRHIEWASDACSLQPAVTEDPRTYDGHGLLGMAIHANGAFGFVVTPQFKQWANPHSSHYHSVGAQFITPDELADDSQSYSIVWPDLE